MVLLHNCKTLYIIRARQVIAFCSYRKVQRVQSNETRVHECYKKSSLSLSDSPWEVGLEKGKWLGFKVYQ